MPQDTGRFKMIAPASGRMPRQPQKPVAFPCDLSRLGGV